MDLDASYRRFRERFPIFRSRVYLDSCSQGALSDAVEAALREHVEIWHARGSPWDRWVELQEELRAEFAALIGASSDEVAITFAASTAIYSVASALDYAGRNQVVLGELEFPTLCHVWLAQEARGAKVVWVRADGAPMPEDYRRAIGPATLIVPAAGVSFRTGHRSDPAALAAAAHEAGAWFMLDDYQSCGTRPVDVHALGVDFYVTGALKYLLGSAGVAFLYVRRELVPRLCPTLTGWFAQAEPFAFDGHRHAPAESAARFQTGTPPVPAIYAALAGIRLLRALGLDAVERRIAELTRVFLEGARDRGWELKTPSDSTGPLVVLRTPEAARLVAELDERGIVVSSRGDGLRVAFHAYNDPEDVDAVLRALDELL
jgi:selenocysteine lyase/cysteine desulfurase